MGITELFASISFHALRCYGIDVRFAHLDTTAMSLQGDYDFEQDDETDEEQVIRITYGHSKDHRPDLKQAVLGMICANRTSIPIYPGAISGNTSDKTSLPDIATTYLAQFEGDEATPILIADSALYSAENIQNLSAQQWVSRVPATITVKQKTYWQIPLKQI